jgi:hypothetical protein
MTTGADWKMCYDQACKDRDALRAENERLKRVDAVNEELRASIAGDYLLGLELEIERLKAEAAVYEKLRLAVGEYQCCGADIDVCPKCTRLFEFAKPCMTPVCKEHDEKLTKAEQAMWETLHTLEVTGAGNFIARYHKAMEVVVEAAKIAVYLAEYEKEAK